jgi:hypothetical protein
MSSPKEKLGLVTEEDETSESREVSLQNGRRLTVTEQGHEQLVEIRGEGGLLELRIQLTAAGPVLQMEALRMELKATEAVAITAPTVEVHASEKLALTAAEVSVKSTGDTTIEAGGEVRVVGTMIYLN